MVLLLIFISSLVSCSKYELKSIRDINKSTQDTLCYNHNNRYPPKIDSTQYDNWIKGN